MTHKDTAGNQLRESDGRWEILQQGVGWREFIGQTVLVDGTLIDTRPPKTQTEEQVKRKSIENDLFNHFASIALEQTLKRKHERLTPTCLAEECCEIAQAMIDEMKERGKI